MHKRHKLGLIYPQLKVNPDQAVDSYSPYIVHIECDQIRLIFSSKSLLIVVLFRLNNIMIGSKKSKLSVHHVCSVKSDPYI